MKIIIPLCLLLVAMPIFATDLKITDVSNAVVVVRDAVLDYGSFVSDKETQGIRINQGEAAVTAKWSNIETITMNGTDDKVEIVLKNGQKVSATLAKKGRMKLSGKTDLGDYSIDLVKIHAISPIT
jgi:hypothetical protein